LFGEYVKSIPIHWQRIKADGVGEEMFLGYRIPEFQSSKVPGFQGFPISDFPFPINVFWFS